MRLPILLLAMALATTGWAADVELTLVNGEILHGVILREDDTTVVVRRAILQRGVRQEVEVEIPRERIGQRTTAASLATQYAAKAAAAPQSWFGQSVLAAWCVERCLVPEAKRHALAALALDPTAKPPRQVMDDLGYAHIAGQWVVESEYLAANNLVRWDGRYIPAAEAQQRRDLAQAIAARNDALADHRLAVAAAALADPAAQAAAADELADLDRGVAKAVAEQERIRSQYQSVGERIKRLNDQRSGSNNTRRITDQIADERKRLTTLTEDLTRAAASEAKLRREAETARRKLALAKAGAAAAGGLEASLTRIEAARAEVARLATGLTNLPPQLAEPADAPAGPATAPATTDKQPAARPTSGAARL
jgi:DNA repair exonuclease SbcCD ATPase subunit